MRLDSVRELKAQLSKAIPERLLRPARAHALAVPAGTPRRAGPERTLAFGISRTAGNDFVLAVRVQRREVTLTPEFQAVLARAKNEVDVRYVGAAYKLAKPWHQRRCRPLRCGCSVGHHKITAGTLGCFVRSRKGGDALMLSNNHALANENGARVGDEILQPGAIDGGVRRQDVVGRLAAFTKLKPTSANAADCATASVDPQDLSRKGNHLDGLGPVAGLGPSFLASGEAVAKVGRTTGLTRGRVTAFEVDNVVVSFGIGQLSFDNQIEIEGDGTAPFSAGGDSGSLIVDGDLQGIALLFAGTDQGGSNGAGLSYGAPLKVVLDQLKVDLL